MTETVIATRIDGVASEEDKNYFFSKAEFDFLKGMKVVSSNYERVLLHRIFRKLACFKEDILPILARNERTSSWAEGITENCNKITEYSNNVHIGEKLENSFSSQNSDEMLVGRTGLEPATFCTSSRCPTELDYRPAGLFYFRFRYIATSS
jgi:hypothetical protein